MWSANVARLRDLRRIFSFRQRPTVKEFEEKVTSAEARAIQREKILFERLCRQSAGLCAALSEFAENIAELDVLSCFAEIARRGNYVRPEIISDPMLDIRQALLGGRSARVEDDAA